MVSIRPSYYTADRAVLAGPETEVAVAATAAAAAADAEDTATKGKSVKASPAQ